MLAVRYLAQSPVAQGVAVFALIVIELNRERPEIPVLIGVVAESDPVFDLENRKPYVFFGSLVFLS